MAEKKVLRVGTLSRIGTLDPRKAIDAVSSMVLNEIFERPYEAPYGTESPKPILFAEPLRAETASGGGVKSWSAVLKSGIKFSDGTPMSGADVARSLSGSQAFAQQATVDSAGDHLMFRLRKPNPRFDIVLSANYTGIVLEKGTSLVGSGPFMFPPNVLPAQIPRMDRVTIVRNPHYQGKVDLDEIVFINFPTSADGGRDVLLEAMKRGEIDFTYSLTSVDAAALRGLPFVPSISTANSTAILHLNTTKPGLNDAGVRRAISFAIDRKAIAESMYERNPFAYVASSLLPPMMGRDTQTFAFEPAKAKQFAEAAGSKMPRQLSLLLLWSPRPYMPNPGRTGELIRDMLAAIGIKLNLVTPRDRTDYFEHIARGNYDLLLGGWIADTVDPADFLAATLASRSIPGQNKDAPTANNASRWANPAMDELLERFSVEPGEANRAAIMKLLVEEAPLVPLIYGQAVAVYSNKLTGFRAHALGRCCLANLQLR